MTWQYRLARKLGVISMQPCTHAHAHTKVQFRVPSLPHFNVFGIWEKAGAPGDKIQIQYDNVQLKKACLRDTFKD